jgi:hypothetical protein
MKEKFIVYKPTAEQIAESITATLPESLTITDFAKAVAHVLIDEYGEGVYGQFLITLNEEINNL